MAVLQEIHSGRQQGQTYNDLQEDHQKVLMSGNHPGVQTFSDPPEDHQEVLTFNDPPEDRMCGNHRGALTFNDHQAALRCRSLLGVLRCSDHPDDLPKARVLSDQVNRVDKVEEDIDLPLFLFLHDNIFL